MKQLSMVFIILLFFSCNGSTNNNEADSSKSHDVNKNKTYKSNYSKKTVDSMIRIGLISKDDVDLPPSQAEERERLKNEYDKIKIIDSVFILNNDTLHFHSKYYCLKNIDLIEPKLFDIESKNPKEFLTHPFVVDLLLIHNRDTVLNKQFKASDFNPYFKDNFNGQLKKYGSILDLYISRSNKDKNIIDLRISLSIPATDLGTGVNLIIDKKGGYKIVGDN